FFTAPSDATLSMRLPLMTTVMPRLTVAVSLSNRLAWRKTSGPVGRLASCFASFALRSATARFCALRSMGHADSQLSRMTVDHSDPEANNCLSESTHTE